MFPALIGVAGVVFGAVAALVGSALSDRRQANSETRKWRREQLGSAYEQALRHLLNAANRRTEFEDGSGRAVLRQEHQREWFDDLVAAQTALHMVMAYCPADQIPRIRRTTQWLDMHVERLVSGERFDEKGFFIWEVLQSCISWVTESARLAGAGEAIPEPDSFEADFLARIAAARQARMTGKMRIMNNGISLVRFSTTRDDSGNPTVAGEQRERDVP